MGVAPFEEGTCAAWDVAGSAFASRWRTAVEMAGTRPVSGLGGGGGGAWRLQG